MTQIPPTAQAVQLTGPGQLKLNSAKPVAQPTGSQILAKVEATGLCFSDLKLLKQFTEHARKYPVVSGVAPELLAANPSYAAEQKPTVPGHETVLRIVAVGPGVKNHKVGDRRLVQADWRWLITSSGTNAAFGYNFEGGLQEYVMLDEVFVTDPESGESMLIPVAEDKSRSAICLVEPWACVEDSYATIERQTIKAGGKLLVVADAGRAIAGLAESFAPNGKPASIAAICADPAQLDALKALGAPVSAASLDALPEKGFDDVVYFGVNADTIEKLNPTLANNAIINIVTAGQKVGRLVQIGLGRIHYGCTRWVGTVSGNAADSYGMIPASGEVRTNDNCLIIGAGGPMGQMHVIRVLCSGVAGIEVIATDFDGPRLDALKAMTQPLADANRVKLRMVNTKDEKLTEQFSYIAVMAPVSAVVAQSVADASRGSIVNIFAGIPAPTLHPFDLDMIIEKRCFLFGTSGSTTRDMKIVLEKVQSGSLDTNLSVDAVSGMAGAIDGIAAVENRTLAGKIIVYPQLHHLGLTPLATIAGALPTVAAKLHNGKWTKAAEDELLAVAK